MKITSIQQQVKRTDRYSLFVDGKYAFSLSEQALLDSKVVSGMELSAQELKDFKKLSQDDKAYGNALRYATMRPRSIGEVRDYFRRKQVEEPVADKILNRLSNLGILNDAVFARLWVENRRLLKSTSRKKLALELRQKHIAADIIDQVLADDREQVDEQAVIRELIRKKRARYPDEQKLLAYLARQGYGYDDIKSALEQVKQED